ncbi:MAG: hypothetical protein H7Z14_10440 [Anaerolineae bacterium]|nr:hypothetical protein [Phycisphaerae bacterium]
MDHVMQQQHVIELATPTVSRPGAKPAKGTVATAADGGSSRGLNSVADAADIIWTNRGLATDNFAARFGTLAETARQVVDAVIVAYERMIGSFNYSSAGQTYSLTLSMNGSGSGFGASANLNSSLNGKAKSGTINMGAGNGSANANDDNGWFIDPTPFDNSEFLGSIVNGYSGNATSGGPASGRGDFFTVVAAEMTHCMGLFGSALPGWASRTTNTGIADTAAAPGFLYVFQGPSIKHLLTSDNGGFQDFGSAVHSSEPGNSISFGGETYTGADDQGNAFYENSRRYMINNAFALMFKDAYNYATVDPAKWGTMYSVLNETSKLVTVRGGTGTNNDTISVTRSGNTVFVSVDPATDVAGTGALPGAGNLPAFVTEYDISQISSISIAAGAGNDIISIAPNIGVPITIDASTGTDSLTIVGTAGDDTIGVAAGTITGASTITYSNFESLAVQGNDGNDTINFNGTGLSNVNVTGGVGDDILSLINVTNASLVFDLGTNANTLNLNSGTYTISTDLGAVGTMAVNINAGTLTFNTTQHLTSLSIASGANGSLLAGGTRAMILGGLSIVGTGNLDLNDNDAIIDYTGGSQMNAIRAMINSARNGGDFTGTGLNSTAARNASPENTTLGAMEGSEYHAINGPASTFAGTTFDDSSVLVKYTYYGDADYNGVVDFDDYSRVDAGFNSDLTGWVNGDVDGNGVVDFDDYSLIDLAFNTQVGVL